MMLQLFGEKKKSALFPLKKPSNDEDGKESGEQEEKEKDENVDVYTTNDTDLGKV
jgi:hypothetical protein